MSDQDTSKILSEITRRDFTKKASVGAAAVGMAPLLFPNVGAAEGGAKKKFKVGVVGLGGRGSGAVKDILRADPDTILWAAGDIFEDRMKRIGSFEKQFSGRVDTDGGKRHFVGFDAYQKVIDSGVDIVLLTSTPAFRPLHFEAAVAAGKHVFLEKPIALDIPGLKSVVESAKKAQSNGLSVLTGLVWRYSPHLMELHKRIQDGEIGDVLTASSAYSGGGRPNKMPDIKYKPASMSDMEWAQRYWQSYLELGGDGILEFMIHGIDRMSWAMGDGIPVKCYANGANIHPVKGANSWDSFSLRYEYADGRIADFLGRQIPGTYSPSGDTIVGTKGQALAKGHNMSIVRDGKTVWQKGGGLGYVNEHKILTKHIRKGEVYNDVLDKMANSHVVGIMGRTAAYTGKLITGKQIMSSKDLLIETKGMTFDTPFTARPAAMPGKTKFV
ncbi:Gfo/Idh/MocA family protein [Rubritalea tangerina]|uniref:Gfo/Idh/MocA family protein n=1 Tax=Rubritalea tangerina TaxID=430798 RepID=A0ABW4ZDI2_9BACT